MTSPLRCPRCGSEKVKVAEPELITWHTCLECGWEFVDEDDKPEPSEGKEVSMKFDHDNEGKAPLSPHAAMARMEAEKKVRDDRPAEHRSADLGLSGFWLAEGDIESTKDDAEV